MQCTKRFDDSLRETLAEISNQVEASGQLWQKVERATINEKKKEILYMKKPFILKRTMILAAVLCLTTITVFAAGHIKSYVTRSSAEPAYTSFPSEKELNKDLGFVPSALETFSNGYTFKEAVIGSTAALDDNDKEVGTYKNIYYSYGSDQGETVSLTIHKQMPGETTDPKATATDYNGITLSYVSQQYKFVPPDYELTEEDKKAEQSGEVVFSYGSDSVESEIVQSINWTDNGISYGLMAFDSKLTQADFADMAAQIIDANE